MVGILSRIERLRADRETDEVEVADIVGIRALLIHAKDDRVRAFYLHQAEFEPSPTDSFHLFLLVKDMGGTPPIARLRIWRAFCASAPPAAWRLTSGQWRSRI